MNINCILSVAYIDVVVPCRVPDVWTFSPLGLCLSLGRQWAPKLCISVGVVVEALSKVVVMSEAAFDDPQIFWTCIAV